MTFNLTGKITSTRVCNVLAHHRTHVERKIDVLCMVVHSFALFANVYGMKRNFRATLG